MSMRHHYWLLGFKVLNTARAEVIVQDSTESFYLVDGDSLLYEAAQTKTWQPGQQLHLFYIIELYLNRLIQNAGRCEIVFFKDMEKIWCGDMMMRIFRCALIQHLSVNCNLVVHCEWESIFSEEWKAYLHSEQPSFIFIHDGYGTPSSMGTMLRIHTLHCLSRKLDIAFTSGLYVESSRLYATYVKTESSSVARLRRIEGIFKVVWNDVLELLSLNFVDVPENEQRAVHQENVKNSVGESIEGHVTSNQGNDGHTTLDELFCESVNFYINTLTAAEMKSYVEKHYLSQWAHYFSVISESTISQRTAIIHQTLPSDVSSTPGETEEVEVHSMKKRFRRFAECILRSLHSKMSPSFPGSYSADLLDLKLYQHLFTSKATLSKLCFTEAVINKYSRLAKSLNCRDMPFALEELPICNEKYNALLDKSSASLDKSRNDRYTMEDVSLVFITSQLCEEYAGDVRNSLRTTTDIANVQEGCSGYAFDERYHWHSGKPLLDDGDLHKDKSLSPIPFLRDRQLKDTQRFNDHLMMYGASLVSNPPIVIVPAEKTNKKGKNKVVRPEEKIERKPAIKDDHKEKKSKKKGKKSQDIIEENNTKRRLAKMEKVSTKWRSLRVALEKMEDDKDIIKELSTFINSNIYFEEALLYLLKVQYVMWQSGCCDDGKPYSLAAALIHSMHKVLQEETNQVSDKMKKTVASYFRKLGYAHVAQMIHTVAPDEISEKCFVDIPYNILQMQYMGHLMKRNERLDPDPRVTGFIPDTWQRQLLDVVDNNHSALVVAPTSSGKTFCSYYCMERVLRESNDGIVAYISPTKALVNQVHASIYARYRKRLPDGQSVVGVFTRDYQHNAMTCQILVTVPQCLEILLLSPKRETWASRLKYVIFDEVHCIGGEIGGAVWEHLITLIRCPFLALSATIGNPEEFHKWLCSVQTFKYERLRDTKGKKVSKMDIDGTTLSNANVELVIYGERYSDVNKNIYLPETEAGGDKIIGTHPCMFLDGYSLSKNGFPSGLKFSPEETYELWLASKDTFKDDPNTNLDEWSPVIYFGNTLFISKQQAREYEIKLKEMITKLLKGCPIRSCELIKYFRDKLPFQNVGVKTDKYVNIPGCSEMEFDKYKSFPKLIEQLKEVDKLPVIVFMNERGGVEKLIYALQDHIIYKRGEAMRKMTSVIEQVVKLRKRIEGQIKCHRDDKKKERYDYDQNAAKREHNKHQLRIRTERRLCTFASPGTVSEEDLDKLFKRIPEEHVGLFQLGIAYHHAGCNAKSRKAVEMLFRSKYIQVVAATGTLALGIHMPCKSVVFVGDDHYVDALSYRQMSGRSGRRGFDNIGNVIFYGVPVQKISKLIKSDLSRLHGLYPISCTLVLRLLLLVSNSANKLEAHEKAMTVLGHPFFAHQKPSFHRQLQHFFLFVTDFLARQLLIDGKGVPLQFAGLVTHLHYHEPGNMVFVYLLREGFFHEICKPLKTSRPTHFGHSCNGCHQSPIVGEMYKCTECYYEHHLCQKCFPSKADHCRGKQTHTRQNYTVVKPNSKYSYSEATMRLLVCIMSHLFCTVGTPSVRLKAGKQELKIAPRYGSKVLLDALPPQFLAAIQSYNAMVSSNFSNYLLVVSNSLPNTSSAILPLSHHEWEMTPADHNLSMQNACAVIPFVQLSGCTNKHLKAHCLDREEIYRILPTEIFMDFKSIPALDIDETKNAYALDFFKHMSLKALFGDNMLRTGDVFTLLQDFTLMLMSIATALEQLGPEDIDDHVILAFKYLAYVYRERFQAAFPGRKFKK